MVRRSVADMARKSGAAHQCATPATPPLSARSAGNVVGHDLGNVGNAALASMFAAARPAGSVWNRVWGNVLGNAGAFCWLGPRDVRGPVHGCVDLRSGGPSSARSGLTEGDGLEFVAGRVSELSWFRGLRKYPAADSGLVLSGSGSAHRRSGVRAGCDCWSSGCPDRRLCWPRDSERVFARGGGR